MALSAIGAPLRNLVAFKSFIKKQGGYVLEALPEDHVENSIHNPRSFHYDNSTYNGVTHSHAADINFKTNERENLVLCAAVSQSMGLGTVYSLYGHVPGHDTHLHSSIGSLSSLGRGVRRATPGDLVVWDTQPCIHSPQDNLSGPDTKKRLLALREASTFGGVDFPFGVSFAQNVVNTPEDDVWGINSKRAHDTTIHMVQTVWKAAGIYTGELDFIWGPLMEAGWQKFLTRY